MNKITIKGRILNNISYKKLTKSYICEFSILVPKCGTYNPEFRQRGSGIFQVVCWNELAKKCFDDYHINDEVTINGEILQESYFSTKKNCQVNKVFIQATTVNTNIEEEDKEEYYDRDDHENVGAGCDLDLDGIIPFSSESRFIKTSKQRSFPWNLIKTCHDLDF